MSPGRLHLDHPRGQGLPFHQGRRVEQVTVRGANVPAGHPDRGLNRTLKARKLVNYVLFYQPRSGMLLRRVDIVVLLFFTAKQTSSLFRNFQINQLLFIPLEKDYTV